MENHREDCFEIEAEAIEAEQKKSCDRPGRPPKGRVPLNSTFSSITNINLSDALSHSRSVTIEAEYQVGDVVEIVIGDEDSDDRYDGMNGEIVGVDSDDLGGLTGDPADDFMYTVELESGEVPGIHFRERDLVSRIC